uniref:ribosomal protein S3 n=1 Tax=Fomitopsis dickinsii TaxID=3151107 RepID=UPI002A7EC0C1|nr:ribosomal protein S3 [Daedalea dickinsii]WNZ34359.1 ribosomal protein S3 [Daedalea dickinsii]
MIKNLESNNLKSNLTIRPYGRAKFYLPLERLNNSYENLIKSRKVIETGDNSSLNTKNFQRSVKKISKFNKKNLITRTNNKKQLQLILNTKKIKVNKNISRPKIKISNKNKINFNELIKNLNNLSKFNPYLAQSQHIYYFFNKSNNKIIKNISSIIEISFSKMSSLISKPVYFITPKNFNINLFIFLSKLKKKNNSKFLTLKNTKNLEILSANLSKFSKKKVHFELNRIRKIFFDSNILANYIAARSEIKNKNQSSLAKRIFNSFTNFNRLKNNPLYNAIIPSFLTGMSIKVAGRLSRQKLSLRKTVKVYQRGGLTRRTADFVSNSRVTWFNKRGAFSITAKIGHKIQI